MSSTKQGIQYVLKEHRHLQIVLTSYIHFSFRKSVFHKLYDLYIEECEKEPEVKVRLAVIPRLGGYRNETVLFGNVLNKTDGVMSLK